jgi:excisionase family DNA binding protein
VKESQGIDRAPEAAMLRSLMIDHAAELLGVSRRTIYYRIREGRLRTVRTACGSQRVLTESLEALMREELRPHTHKPSL